MNYTTNPPGSTDFESFMTYANAFTPQHAIPLITVNFGTGTPQEAAAWVNYANKVKNYGIKYWQIGNETEGTWETGGPIPTQDYVRRYIEYYDAMKAVDPSIIITGPVGGGFGDSSNMYDGNGVVHDFISILSAKGKIDHLNAIDYHWYPNYGTASNPYTPASALASTSTLDAYPGQLNGWLAAAGVASPTTVPVLMSEYNVDPSDLNFQVQLGNGLWVADALGHFITDFGNRGFSNLWDTLNGGSGTTSPTGGDLGYLNVKNDAYQYQAHATYWAMQMMTNDWAKPGDINSHQLISTTVNGPTAPLFAAYSDYRPDGIVSLIVINKDPTNTYNTWITGLPFTPNNANGWTYSSTNYQWVTTGATPYHANPDTAPTAVTFLTGGTSSFPVVFQPYSITVLQFTNSGQPTNTPTISPTPTNTLPPTNTPTLTATPNYSTVTLVDDFEDLTRDGTPPARTNLWGGTWGTYVDTNGSTIGIQYGAAAPGAAGTNYAVRITGTMAASSEYSGFISTISPGWPPVAYNLSGYGIIGLQFWIYGDGNTYRMMVDNQSVTDYDNYGVNITPPTGKWTFYQIPFSAMVTQGWGTQTGLPPTETGTDITGIQFATQFGGKSYNVELDQIAFYTAAGVTPTATLTPTNTSTFTPTPSPTPTLTPTPTGTWLTSTPTNSPTATPTITFTPATTFSTVKVDVYNNSGVVIRHLYSYTADSALINPNLLAGLQLSAYAFIPNVGGVPNSQVAIISSNGLTLVWDGKDDASAFVQPGCYFIEASLNNTQAALPVAVVSNLTVVPTCSLAAQTVTPSSLLTLFPNPVKDSTPLGFYYSLKNPTDQVKVKIFTLSFRKIFEDDALATTLGQNSYSLDWGKAGLNLANGLYYVVIYLKSSGSETHQVMKLLIQR